MDFKERFKLEFLHPGYEYRIKDELRARTQGDGESLREYVRCMQDLYERAEPAAPEAEKVFRVVRQCHPRFQPYLRSRRFSDFDDLAKEATAIQASLVATESYQPPPPKEACLEPSCACIPQAPSGLDQPRSHWKRATQRARKAALFAGRCGATVGSSCSADSPQRRGATVASCRSADSPQRCGATVGSCCSADSPQRRGATVGDGFQAPTHLSGAAPSWERPFGRNDQRQVPHSRETFSNHRKSICADISKEVVPKSPESSNKERRQAAFHQAVYSSSASSEAPPRPDTGQPTGASDNALVFWSSYHPAARCAHPLAQPIEIRHSKLQRDSLHRGRQQCTNPQMQQCKDPLPPWRPKRPSKARRGRRVQEQSQKSTPTVFEHAAPCMNDMEGGNLLQKAHEEPPASNNQRMVSCWPMALGGQAASVDNAPFITVKVAGLIIPALLDTGATVSVFGDTVGEWCSPRKIKFRHVSTSIRTASDQVVPITAAARLTVIVDGRKHRQRFLYLPGLSCPAILGRDFMARTGLVLDVKAGNYHYGPGTPLNSFAAGPSESLSGLLTAETTAGNVETGLRTILMSFAGPPKEQSRLAAVLQPFTAMFTEAPGTVKILEHHIETGDARPLRFNPRPLSVHKQPQLDGALQEMTVLERMQNAGLTVNPRKVQLAASRIELLGFVVDQGSVRPNEEKLKAILQLPKPENVKSLQRFLGMVGFYRHFIPNCADLARPLHQLLRKGAKWSWTASEEQAFQALSTAIADTTSLRLPDLNRPFVVQTDASEYGIGAVLLQEHSGELYPLAFASRTLSAAEQNYSVTEKECLAIVFALKKFNMYLDGADFTIQTDHQALSWLSRLQNPAGRLARWALNLQKYHYKVEYKKGTSNKAADALSRAPLPAPQQPEPQVFAVTTPAEAWGTLVSRQKMLEAQQADEQCKRIRESITAAENDDTTAARAPDYDCYVQSQDGLLLRYIPSADTDSGEYPFRVFVPKRLRRSFLEYYHDTTLAGHSDGQKTYEKLCRVVTWPCMRKEVMKYARTCPVCQSVKPRGGKPPGLMKSVESRFPWQIAACDVMGPYPRSVKGNRYLLVVTDHFSKWVELYALRKLDSKLIWDKLLDTFTRFGFPEQLITDNATYFTSKNFVDTCSVLGVVHKKTTPYHPQANITERVNRNLKMMLVAFTERHKDWDARLSEMAFATRTTVNRSTGFTPAALLFGRDLCFPVEHSFSDQVEVRPRTYVKYAQDLCSSLNETIQEARQHLDLARLEHSRQYDKGRRRVEFSVGDLVLRRTHPLSDAAKGFAASLADRWEGPYEDALPAERYSNMARAGRPSIPLEKSSSTAAPALLGQLGSCPVLGEGECRDAAPTSARAR
ncbi:uncharacterized protein LOC144161810 [Haemaphysalis longicornis]